MKRVFVLSIFMMLGFSSLAAAETSGPVINPYAAYPPSCLADPLPSAPEDPSWSFGVKLAARQSGSSAATTEAVTLYFWRSYCNSGKPALLGRLQRSAANEGRTDVEPLFPQITVLDHTVSGLPRVAAEPNTVRSFIAQGEPVAQSTTFVFENFSDAAALVFDYTQDLTIVIGGVPAVSAAIPAFNLSQFPDSSDPMPISGYNSGAYYDPAHSGEGIMLEVGESSPTLRYIFIGWFTYGTDGTPYWISGLGTFIARTRSLVIPMTYTFNGGFGGDFGHKASVQNWGTLRINGFTCSSMDFQFTALPGLPTGVPHGSASRKWTRLTQMNGLNCN